MLSQQQLNDLLALLGEQIESLVSRRVKRAVDGIWFGRTATVATTAVTGGAITRTFTGPNGDTRTEAAVWMDEQTADAAVWVPVRPGLTVAEGEVVRVVRDRPNSPPAQWLIDARL